MTAYPSIESFFAAHEGQFFSFWHYRHMFTPYEQEQKFSDESVFDGTTAIVGKVAEVICLPDGDVLLGIKDEFDDSVYYKLSELYIERIPYDDEPNGCGDHTEREGTA